MVTTTKVNLGIECPFCGSKPLLECTEVYENPRDNPSLGEVRGLWRH